MNVTIKTHAESEYVGKSGDEQGKVGTLAKTCFIRLYCGNPELIGLKSLLIKLGLPKQIKQANGGYRVVLGNKPSEADLWEAYEAAKETHRRKILVMHPDKGGSHEQAAKVNDLWRMIRQRFLEKYGIG